MSDERSTLPRLAEPRGRARALEAVRMMGDGFDVDAWHCMEARDDQLVAEEILHGAGSASFVYSFEINRKLTTGVSVVGARHLAAHYKGLKHRLVASMQKTGALFTFTSYPAENLPMSVSASVVHELADEADYYAAVCEMLDLKTGNAIQVERREARFEYSRDGNPYERPNYSTIAQSKAYRNAVLALVPQDVLIRWKLEMLKLDRSELITDSVLDQKRANVLRFAAQRAIALDRRAVEALTLDQIAGLGDAAREGRLPAFVEAAKAVGLDLAAEDGKSPVPEAAPEPQEPRRRGRPPRAAPVAEGPPAPAAVAQEAPPQQPAAEPQPPLATPSGRRVNFEM
jgi:hypothetical protein